MVLQKSKQTRPFHKFFHYFQRSILFTFVYHSSGNCYGSIMEMPPKARKLRWEISMQCQNILEDSNKEAQILISDLQLHILRHDAYGKGFMKKCKLSPDAYIQMAMQLAYYRDAGKFCLTYEASMTRLFREGRTETVRPCTMDAVAWARAMDDPSKSASLITTFEWGWFARIFRLSDFGLF